MTTLTWTKYKRVTLPPPGSHPFTPRKFLRVKGEWIAPTDGKGGQLYPHRCCDRHKKLLTGKELI